MNFSIAARIVVICSGSDVDAFSLAAGYVILKGPKRKRKHFQAASSIKELPNGVTEATYSDGSKIHSSWNELQGIKLCERLV